MNKKNRLLFSLCLLSNIFASLKTALLLTELNFLEFSDGQGPPMYARERGPLAHELVVCYKGVSMGG